MTTNRIRSLPSARRLVPALLLATALAPTLLAAQGQTPGDTVAEAQDRVEGPSFGRVALMFSQYYDDNLFAVSNSQHPQSDLVSRFGPTFEVGRHTRRLDLKAKYGLAAERYVEQITLNNDVAYQDGGFDIRYSATPRLELRMNGSYIDTLTPQELNTVTLLNPGRMRAEQLRGQVGAVRELTRVLRLKLDYEVSNETVTEQPTNLSQSGRIGLEWRTSGRMSYRVDGRMSHVRFARLDLMQPIIGNVATVPTPLTPPVFGRQTTETITGGVTYALTPLTSVEVDGGARFSPGEMFPEFSGTIRRRMMQKGELGAGFVSTQDTSFGQPGFVQVKRAGVIASVSPTRHLTLRATPAYARSEFLGIRTEVTELDVAITVRVLQRLSFVASGRALNQLSSFSAADDPILSRRISLTTTLTLP